MSSNENIYISICIRHCPEKKHSKFDTNSEPIIEQPPYHLTIECGNCKSIVCAGALNIIVGGYNTA
jgi:hypothetical protein